MFEDFKFVLCIYFFGAPKDKDQRYVREVPQFLLRLQRFSLEFLRVLSKGPRDLL